LLCEQARYTVSRPPSRVRATRTGRPRLIVLPPPALDVLTKQKEKYQTGYLFRTLSGTPYTCPGLTQAVWRLAERIGRPIWPYSLRQSYATDALAAGIPSAHVAALLGHTSTAMLERTYSHLTAKTQLLKDAAAKVRPA
jgi:integrase